MSEPLVSIIVPVFQRVDLAIEAINSAINQTYQNIEIIVGDNHSTDGTYEKLYDLFHSINNIILFQNDVNLGPVGNWEACLSRANGDYIKFLWSDDLIREDYIDRAITLLEANPEASFAFSGIKIFNQISDINTNMMARNEGDSDYKAYSKSGVYSGLSFIKNSCTGRSVPVSPGCAVFRREKLVVVNHIPNNKGYDHRSTGAGIDLLMFFEALSHGESFIYFENICSYFRSHPQSITSFDTTVKIGYRTAKVYFLRKHFFDIRFFPVNICVFFSAVVRKIHRKEKSQ